MPRIVTAGPKDVRRTSRGGWRLSSELRARADKEPDEEQIQANAMADRPR
jgi:hypothetical protein